MLVTNEVFAANKVGGIKGTDESIEKYGKLSKGLKLFKSRNLKDKKLAKFKKPSKSRNLLNLMLKRPA